jgi:23S rRNA (cytidine2498-2'-O)-methyltransferase
VRHLRVTAEAYLADDPDMFDVIVNDMRMDGRDSARLMIQVADFLYPHGVALMTVKLPEHKRRAVIDHARRILEERYAICGMKQLFHNRSELTVYLRPKDRRDVET